MENAIGGIEKLKQNVDTLIVIPNDKLLEIVDRRTSITDAFKKADEVLQQSVRGITDLINIPALINLDFADVRTVMLNKGIAHIGIGTGTGDDKAEEAVKGAVTSPLLETNIRGASHVIINISGDISLIEANDAASYVQDLAGDGANIIFGARYEAEPADTCTITVIATGINDSTIRMASPNIQINRNRPQPAAQQAYQQPQQAAAPAPQPAAQQPQPETERPFVVKGEHEAERPQQAKPVLNFQVPRQPRQTVQGQDITIPDFLKRR